MFFESLIENESQESVMVGVFPGESLVGLCGLTASEEQDSLEVIQMYVSSSHRGQSISHQLLAAAKSVLSERAENKLILTVYTENHSAVKVYKNFGFKRISQSENELVMVFES